MAAENIDHQRNMALPDHDAMLPADVCRQPTGRPHALRTYGHPRRAGLKQWGVHKGESRGAREPHPRFRCLLSSSRSSSPLVGFLHPRPFFVQRPRDVLLYPHDFFRLCRAGAGVREQRSRCSRSIERLASGVACYGTEPGIRHLHGQICVRGCAAPSYPACGECHRSLAARVRDN